MSMDKNGLDNRIAIVTVVAAAAIVLLGGFAIPSVYAQATQFKTDFETSLIPACATEEVAFSGTQHFVFDENLRNVHVQFSNVHGEGLQTGTQYTIHENDHFTSVTSENGDTIFKTTMSSRIIGSGPTDNTKITVKIVTILHPNGDTETTVDDVKVQCSG